MIKPEDDKDGLCWRRLKSRTIFYDDWHEEFLLECGHTQKTRSGSHTPYIEKTVCDTCQNQYEFNKKQIPLIPNESVKSSAH